LGPAHGGTSEPGVETGTFPANSRLNREPELPRASAAPHLSGIAAAWGSICYISRKD